MRVTGLSTQRTVVEGFVSDGTYCSEAVGDAHNVLRVSQWGRKFELPVDKVAAYRYWAFCCCYDVLYASRLVRVLRWVLVHSSVSTQDEELPGYARRYWFTNPLIRRIVAPFFRWHTGRTVEQQLFEIYKADARIAQVGGA